MKQQAIFIMGPTAIGKTALAIELTKYLPCDLISVDSAMVYRGMDIGTGKPEAQILKDIPHKLVNIIDPNQIYSVGKFCTDAYTAMHESILKRRIPVLVGGTMMYFWALQQGLSTLPSAVPRLREEILVSAEKYGWPALYKKLQILDPITADKLKVTDKQRIQRALEVIYVSGKPLSSYTVKNKLLADWQLHIFKLLPESRAAIHTRIAQRFQQMLDLGLINEVEQLVSINNIAPRSPVLRAVGYRQVLDFLQGKINRLQLLELGIIATRQLSKRQFTWLKRWDSGDELIVSENALISGSTIFDKEIVNAAHYIAKKVI